MSGTTEKVYPMVLVFYLDREMMKNQEITQAFAESVNELINVKNFNAIAFFLPTDGEERIECINPLIAPKEKMEQINKLISDISKNFGIGEEITFTESSITSVFGLNLESITPRFEIVWDYHKWKPMVGKQALYTQEDWNQTLMTTINQTASRIGQINENKTGNKIFVNEVMDILLSSLAYYRKNSDSRSIGDRYEVIIDNTIIGDKIYVTYSNDINIDVNNIGLISVKNYLEEPIENNF